MIAAHLLCNWGIYYINEVKKILWKMETLYEVWRKSANQWR